MQPAEVRLNKNSLLLALRRYNSAVSDMEQTILLPSLLRDVPSDKESEESCTDLYGNYLMLKAIRNMAECGLVPLDDHKIRSGTTLSKTLEPVLDTDTETLFRFHLRGLFSVVTDLTEKTQSLTGKYMDIIGAGN